MRIYSKVNTPDATNIHLCCIYPPTHASTHVQVVVSRTFEPTNIIAEVSRLDKMPTIFLFTAAKIGNHTNPKKKINKTRKKDWCEAKLHWCKMRSYLFIYLFISTSQYVFIRRQIQVSSLFCHLVFSQSVAGVCTVRYGTHRREANKTVG